MLSVVLHVTLNMNRGAGVSFTLHVVDLGR